MIYSALLTQKPPDQKTHSLRANNKLRRFLSYLFPTTAWVVLVLTLSRAATDQGLLWLALAAATLISIPTLMTALYSDTVRVIHRSSLFRAGGLLKRLTTSRILSTLLWSAWSLLFGYISVFWFSTLTDPELGMLFLSIGLLYLVNQCVLKLTNRELVGYSANAEANRLSRLVFAIIMSALALSFAYLWPPSPENTRLAPEMAEIAVDHLDTQKSFVVQISTKAFKHLQAIQAFSITNLREAETLQLAAVCVGTFALFYNFSLLISGFLIPPAEYRRVLTPIDAVDVPRPVSMGTTIFTSTIVTLSLFLLLPATASLEFILRSTAATQSIVSEAERKLVLYAEEIDGVLYKPGTIEQIAAVGAQTIQEQSDLLTPIKSQGRQAFQAMRRNVDVYLDRYYSLPAEYLRVAGALTGNVEALIRKELTETLMEGQAIAKLDTAILDALEQKPEVMEAYKHQVAEILSANQIVKPAGDIFVVGSSSLQSLQAPPEDAVLVSLEQRMGAAGVSAIGGVVTAKIVSKVAAKGTIKMAAKAMTKVATNKLATGAAGAAAGAAVGSIVPIAGTAVGAAIGFTTGLVLGVGVDAGLLWVEEKHSREAFKAQILEAIDEQERELISMLTSK